MTLAVNMGMCPDGTVVVTVHGGNPKTVAAMILQCLPPGTPTDGDTLVEIEGTVVRLNHVDPTPEQPEDFVAPLPLVTPEGRHEPMGSTLPGAAAMGPRFQSRFGVLIVAGALVLGGILLGVLLSS